MVALARARYPNAILAVAGVSMGGGVSMIAFGSDDPPPADRLVLLSPAVWGWDAQPWIYRSTLWLGARVIGPRQLEPPSWVLSRILASDNLEHLRRMGRDPLLIFNTRVDALYGLVDLMQRALVSVGSIARPPPVFYAYGRNDEIIPPEPSFQAARQLQPGDRSAWYRQGWHMLTRDLARAAVIEDVLAFIRDPEGPLPSGAPPIPSARATRRA